MISISNCSISVIRPSGDKSLKMRERNLLDRERETVKYLNDINCVQWLSADPSNPNLKTVPAKWIKCSGHVILAKDWHGGKIQLSVNYKVYVT